MAKKTVKKTATKKVVAKKSVVKKPVAKKQSVARVVTPAPVAHECGCHCCCGCGHRLIGLGIKVVILCMVFLLGCLSAPWFMKTGPKHMMPRTDFDNNGCVVLESVKCPKMLEALANADENADGCISRAEFKKVMSEMHRRAPMPKPEQPSEPMPVEIAE